MKDENGIRPSIKQKSPAERVLRGCSVPKAGSGLLLGGGGFAGPHFEAFLAENAAALFGSFFKLLSHSGESL